MGDEAFLKRRIRNIISLVIIAKKMDSFATSIGMTVVFKVWASCRRTRLVLESGEDIFVLAVVIRHLFAIMSLYDYTSIKISHRTF